MEITSCSFGANQFIELGAHFRFMYPRPLSTVILVVPRPGRVHGRHRLRISLHLSTPLLITPKLCHAVNQFLSWRNRGGAFDKIVVKETRLDSVAIVNVVGE